MLCVQSVGSPGLMTAPKRVVVAVVARRAFVQLHRVHLCPFLDHEAICTVNHALAVSCFNYCNVLYLGLLLKSIWKLQLYGM